MQFARATTPWPLVRLIQASLLLMQALFLIGFATPELRVAMLESPVDIQRFYEDDVAQGGVVIASFAVAHQGYVPLQSRFSRTVSCPTQDPPACTRGRPSTIRGPPCGPRAPPTLS